jgi:hypothetical protein
MIATNMTGGNAISSGALNRGDKVSAPPMSSKHHDHGMEPRRHILTSATLVIAALLAACADLPPTDRIAASILAGVDDDVDPGVVGLVFAGTIACSGTLIGPRIVLTAAHCMTARTPEVVFFGPSLAIGGETITVADVRLHPDFDAAVFDHDLALVLLTRAASATPWPVVTSPLDDSWIGRSVRIVGFGTSDRTAGTAGRKREGTATVTSVGALDLRIAPAPARTCTGDSGGPAFVDVGGVEHLVGVTSSGDPGCLMDAVEARVDLDAAGFIQDYANATAAGTAELGERCFYDEHCATGRCAAPVRPPAFRYCTRACGGAGDCAPGMTCVGDCRWPAAEPGAEGAPCTDASDCAVSECARAHSDDERVCANRCFPENVMACPDEQVCETSVDRPTRSACFVPIHDGSCSGQPGPSSAMIAVVLIALGLPVRRRTAAR